MNKAQEWKIPLLFPYEQMFVPSKASDFRIMLGMKRNARLFRVTKPEPNRTGPMMMKDEQSTTLVEAAGDTS